MTHQILSSVGKCWKMFWATLIKVSYSWTQSPICTTVHSRCQQSGPILQRESQPHIHKFIYTMWKNSMRQVWLSISSQPRETARLLTSGICERDFESEYTQQVCGLLLKGLWTISWPWQNRHQTYLKLFFKKYLSIPLIEWTTFPHCHWELDVHLKSLYKCEPFLICWGQVLETCTLIANYIHVLW